LNDFLLIELCLLLAFTFRLLWWPGQIVDVYWPVFLVTPATVLYFLYRSDLYSSVTRHVGTEVLRVSARGVSFGVLCALLAFFLYPISPPLPRSVLLLFWIFSVFFIQVSRLVAGSWLHGTPIPALILGIAGGGRQRKRRGTPVAVYGAGQAGRQLASALSQGNRYYPVAFLDDNPALVGEVVAGLKVFSPSDLPEIIKSHHDFEVLMAIPSVQRQRRHEIIRFLEPFDVHVRSVPSMEELVKGAVQVDDIREVDVVDILGRDIVPPDTGLLSESLRGKTIVVTGAGGSIGSELCRQIIAYEPDTLLLLDHCEYSLYTRFSEVEELHARTGSTCRVLPVIGSVTNGAFLDEVFAIYKPQLVFHCAAYKHVPLVEANAFQGFCNNVVGTLVLARCAMVCNIEKVVLISTDKAVRPTNIMGATKRLSELALQAISQLRQVSFAALEPLFEAPMPVELTNNTQFVMVRFGNVLESSGSVVPKFRKQIRAGGPVTVTHPDVTRFFMTIPEAGQLVLQANCLGESGDIFLLDMGEAIKIDDLAKKLIHLSGLSLKDDDNPEGDIEICYTGIRPGEKLYEELLIDHSSLPTSHPKIKKACESFIPWQEFCGLLVELKHALCAREEQKVQELLARPEIGYHSISG
jgi:UDP-N-acetylglucosamine 4,6-dehydratase